MGEVVEQLADAPNPISRVPISMRRLRRDRILHPPLQGAVHTLRRGAVPLHLPIHLPPHQEEATKAAAVVEAVEAAAAVGAVVETGAAAPHEVVDKNIFHGGENFHAVSS